MKRMFCIVSGLGCGVALAFAFINPYSREIKLSGLVLQLSGTRGSFTLGVNLSELLSLTIRMLPNFIFELYMGTELYSHFCIASVYIFSRTPQRLRWYRKELVSMAIAAFFFQLTLMLTVVFTTSIHYQLKLDLTGLVLFFYHFVIYLLWIYSMALLVNLLAVLLGSNVSFQVLVGVQIILISLLMLIDMLKEHPDLVVLYINLNPIARMVLGWHSGGEFLSEVLSPPYSGLNLNASLMYMLLLCAVSVLLGAFLITRHDFLTANLETEAL